jgi:RNA polymerase sigma-70 factor (ECF subfamily)
MTGSSVMPTLPSHTPLSLVGGQDRRKASDGDVARALGAGEAWAAVETWRRFAPMVLRLARRTLGSASEADDVGQEVFCRVYRKVRTLREPDSFRNFIYTCALRVLQTELHRKKMRSWFSAQPPELLDCEGSETLDVEARDLLRRFYRLFERLSARDRLVFVMRRVESMGIDEIAVAMKISESTVKRALAHASSRLSRWMKDEPGLARGESWGR